HRKTPPDSDHKKATIEALRLSKRDISDHTTAQKNKQGRAYEF
ncbi:hypothetical protein CLV54_3156, partial [Compostimonas suwonensis]